MVIKFKYNSYHKAITGVIIIAWAIFHFVGDAGDDRYENGQVKKYGATKNHKSHGTWTWFYKNGKKEMQGDYIEGKREGIWRTWSDTGEKLTESTYKNDKLNGVYYKWDITGKLISKTYYQEDKLVNASNNN